MIVSLKSIYFSKMFDFVRYRNTFSFVDFDAAPAPNFDLYLSFIFRFFAFLLISLHGWLLLLMSTAFLFLIILLILSSYLCWLYNLV